jgi:hypothetical protein
LTWQSSYANYSIKTAAMGAKDIEQHRFKKGESGNPNGRPKGSRNRSTVAMQWLELSEKTSNPVTGVIEQLEQQDIMTLALIKKAKDGDVMAYRELMDSAHGKAQQPIDHTSKGEKMGPPISWITTE